MVDRIDALALGAGGVANHTICGALRAPAAFLVLADQVGVIAEIKRTSGYQPQFQAFLGHRHIQTFDSGDVLRVLVDQVGEVMHYFGAFLRAHAGPDSEAVDRGADS